MPDFSSISTEHLILRLFGLKDSDIMINNIPSEEQGNEERDMTALYIIIIGIAALTALYFLAIMPRMSRRDSGDRFVGVYYAHRGLHDNASDAPENSVKAFQKAVKAGYGIEMDVQLSKDSVPVVFHDFTLERACGKPGRVCDYTYEELREFTLFDSGEKIPRFEDVLSVVSGRVPLIVEIKLEWMNLAVCPVVDRLLRNYGGLYCVESFHPAVLLWYRRYHNDVVRGQLSDGFIKSGEYKGLIYWMMQNLMLNWMTKPDFIAYNHKYADNLSRKICRRLYRHPAVAWTIHSQQELEAAENEFEIFIFDSFVPNSRKKAV